MLGLLCIWFMCLSPVRWRCTFDLSTIFFPIAANQSTSQRLIFEVFFRLRRKIRGTSCPPITTHLLRMLVYVVLSIISMGVQFSVLQKSEQSMWAERKTERSEPKTDVSGAERSPVNWAERWAVILPLTLCSHVLFLFFFLNFMF